MNNIKYCRVVIFLVFLLGFCNHGKSQTQIQKLASERTCSCIDSLMVLNTIPSRDSVAKCFYKGVSDAIEKKYGKNKKGKLKMSGRRFFIVSGDLLFYLQENLNCPSYQQYIELTDTIIIFRR